MKFPRWRRPPTPTAEIAIGAVDYLFRNRVISGPEALALKERIEARTWTYPTPSK